MELILPSLQHMVQHLPMDARITPPPEQTNAAYPTTLCATSESSEAIPETTKSPAGAAPSDPLVKGRNKRRSSGSGCRRQVETNHHSSSNANLIFSPRPYESMYAERAYLTSSLQIQTSNAADLMRQYSLAEARDKSLEAGKERRQLRKYLRLLRSKIIGTAEQQKTIYSRLGELYVEIQSREAWTLSGYQGASFMDGLVPESPSAYSTISSYDISTPTTPLNATSPVFVPQGYFDDFPYPLDHSLCKQEPVDAGRSLDTVVEEGEELVLDPEFNFELSYDGVNTEVAAESDDAGCDVLPWFDVGFKATRSRRLSLPYIQTAWPETQ
ncbi:hypothetical protein G7Z17_g1887 [Cylindrodendrum hubeiense]|uniref:Uncharacterized protein n=1 Tax=Cylindrodendrum hubeiense TaxID=595255 RepID=A0A9P5HKP1_9HYPO|nr:hypothetical protein G7Z17_g1887 [Cylindrodendrum hubeiense]